MDYLLHHTTQNEAMTNLNEKLVDAFMNDFDISLYDMETKLIDDGIYENTLSTHEGTWDKINGSCLSFELVRDKLNTYFIIIQGLDACIRGISSTKYLHSLENAARQYPEITKLIIEIDLSSIVYCFENEHKKDSISLANLKILTKGQSWYNSLGFIGTEHKENLRYWKTLQELPFIKFLSKIDIINDEDDGAIDDLVEISRILEMEPEKLASLTTQQVFNLIEQYLQSTCSKNKCKKNAFGNVHFIISFFDLIKTSDILQYDNLNLTKKLSEKKSPKTKKRKLETRINRFTAKRSKKSIVESRSRYYAVN